MKPWCTAPKIFPSGLPDMARKKRPVPMQRDVTFWKMSSSPLRGSNLNLCPKHPKAKAMFQHPPHDFARTPVSVCIAFVCVKVWGCLCAYLIISRSIGSIQNVLYGSKYVCLLVPSFVCFLVLLVQMIDYSIPIFLSRIPFGVRNYATKRVDNFESHPLIMWWSCGL